MASSIPCFPAGSGDTASNNIPKTGDLTFDKKAEAHRLQIRVTANKGEHLLAGRQQYYVVNDRADSPTNRTMTNDDYQATLSGVIAWLSVINDVITNRYNGVQVETTFTAVTSPDGGSGGIEFNTPITLSNITLSSGSLFVWYKDTIGITLDGNNVVLTTLSTLNGWTLGYNNSITDSGDLIITPTGTASIFDLRLINSSIDTDTLDYYNSDIEDNNGGVVLPL